MVSKIKATKSDVATFAIHLLDLTNRVAIVERNFSHIQLGIEQLINNVNKGSMELVKKMEALEARIADLERLKIEHNLNSVDELHSN